MRVKTQLRMHFQVEVEIFCRSKEIQLSIKKRSKTTLMKFLLRELRIILKIIKNDGIIVFP